MTRALMLVLALSFHMTSIVIACIFVGEYLDRRVPLASLSWLVITTAACLVLIFHNYYVFFRYMLRREERKLQQEKHKDEHDG